jgi:hypothetical protein
MNQEEAVCKGANYTIQHLYLLILTNNIVTYRPISGKQVEKTYFHRDCNFLWIMFPGTRKMEVVNSWKPEQYCEINTCFMEMDFQETTQYKMHLRVNEDST